MKPWWSRPTAEGAEDVAGNDESQPEGSPREDAPEPTPQPDRTSKGEDEAPQRTRAGRGRVGRAAAEGDGEPVAPAARTPAAKEPAAKEPATASEATPAPAEARRAEPTAKQAEPTAKQAELTAKRAEPAARRGRPAARRAQPEAKRSQPDPKRTPAESRAATTGNGGTQKEQLRPGDAVSVPLSQLQDLTREIIISMPDRNRSADVERKLALFCDLENVALGARDSGSKFEIHLVLERLLEKGKIIVKKAYADWQRYSDYKRPFHEAGIELIDIPLRSYSGKNSADIKMVVDAMDMCYSKEHLDTFVLLSGDSDFSPLVSKLKENNKYVIAVGLKESSSNLLIDNCDEFIYYEDIWRDIERVPRLDGLSKKEQELFELLTESILALTRENKDVLWGSMIKQTMQRKKPSFNEGYYGYSTFSELLEDAKKKNIVELEKDKRSGSYIVSGFARRR